MAELGAAVFFVSGITAAAIGGSPARVVSAAALLGVSTNRRQAPDETAVAVMLAFGRIIQKRAGLLVAITVAVALVGVVRIGVV